nr:hypothetical protein [Capnocytophaga canis]
MEVRYRPPKRTIVSAMPPYKNEKMVESIAHSIKLEMTHPAPM